MMQRKHGAREMMPDQVSWDKLHRQSEALAIQAEQACRGVKPALASILYDLAAELEEMALMATLASAPEKVRTKGITAVSAVSLWYKAGKYERAQKLAYVILAWPDIPPFARNDMEALAQKAAHRQNTEHAK